MNWKEQTARARSNGVRMLNMVRRNFTRGTTPMIRCEIYKSLVRPSMEYGSIVWDPHQQTRIKTLEAVQHKGARYVNQYWDTYKSVTTMKKDIGWLTLQERRLVNRLTLLIKSIHNIHGHTLPPHVGKPARALYPRLPGGAVPLRVLAKTAITVVTPPVDFNSFPPTRHTRLP